MRTNRKKFIEWVKQVRKDGVRWTFLHWVIPLILPGFHLAGNPIGGGRRKRISNETPSNIP